ncbi:MAG: hypothetical protein V8S87_08165, partial [Oscillospiraceae bacterium]
MDQFVSGTHRAEVEIFAACGTEAFAVLLAEELRLHIQNEAGFENFAEVYPVALQSEELRIVTGVLLHDDGVKRGRLTLSNSQPQRSHTQIVSAVSSPSSRSTPGLIVQPGLLRRV